MPLTVNTGRWNLARSSSRFTAAPLIRCISSRPSRKSSWMRCLVNSLRLAAHSWMGVPSGSPRFCAISVCRRLSDCVATKIMEPYCPSIRIWRRNDSPSMSLAVLSLTARLMWLTIQMESASLKYFCTTPSRALLSSLTPGASTSLAPVFNTFHLQDLMRIILTIGQKLFVPSLELSTNCSMLFLKVMASGAVSLKVVPSLWVMERSALSFRLSCSTVGGRRRPASSTVE
mmetsp:Transcript_19729/g.54806  ORF Transcript_19729/g.54806 Transcript_19729/m.54806 type:complete len:230 (+) Transcript_19729:1622-2311(+)